jgi:hypothetical protein
MLVGGDAPLGRGVVRRGLERPPEGEELSEVYELLGIHPSFSAAGARAGGAGLSWPSRLVQQAQLLQFGVEFAGGLTLLRFCFTQEDRRKYAFYFQWRCFDLRPEWRVFLHFLNPAGEISFQGDHSLGEAAPDASGLLYVRQAVQVPAEAPEGRYRIRLGVWTPERREHLPLLRHRGCRREAPGWCHDAVLLGSLRV